MIARILLLAVTAIAAGGSAGPAARAPSRNVQAQLVSEVESIQPGQVFWVGLHLRMAPEWHTYWVNPGDAGLPTRLTWKLPEGFRAGPIEWPYPEVFSQGPVTSYGYEHEVLLPVAITPIATLAPSGPVTLSARAEWLECREGCFPGRAELSLTLPARPGPPSPSAAWARAFADTRRRLPAQPAGWTFRAQETPSDFLLVLRPPKAWGSLREARFFPARAGVIDHAAPQDLGRARGAYRLRLTPAAGAARPLSALSGVLVARRESGEVQAVRVEAAAVGRNVTARGGGLPLEEETR